MKDLGPEPRHVRTGNATHNIYQGLSAQMSGKTEMCADEMPPERRIGVVCALVRKGMDGRGRKDGVLSS